MNVFASLVLAILISAFSTGSVSAQVGGEELPPVGKGRYDHCLSVASRAPTEAFALGLRWHDEGGGLPARHCMALALAGDRRYEAAAAELEGVAEDLRVGRGMGFDTQLTPGDPIMLANLYAQAGNAWLLADQPLKAYEALSQGLAEIPSLSEQALELRVDRARASAMAGDYDLALEDLNKALQAAPTRVDILIYRASAYRYLERVDDAQADLAQALRFSPDDRDALLERGNLNLLTGDIEAARADWLKVASLYPESMAAEAARRNIEQIDLNSGGQSEGRPEDQL